MADRIITVTAPSVVTNDTLDSYNNYSDIDGLLGSMTPTEGTNGKTVTLSDGSVHEITTKPVGTTNGEFAAVISNAVTVDLSGGGAAFVPWEDANTLVALLSDSPTPIDVSQASDGTGGSPQLSQGSNPTNLNGWNTFVRADEQWTRITGASITFPTGVFTTCLYVKPTVMPAGINSLIYDGGGLNTSIQMRTDGNWAFRPSGLTLSHQEDMSGYSVGTPILITMRRDASNDCFLQLNNDAEINMGNTADAPKYDAHGSRNNGTVDWADISIGRRIWIQEDLGLDATKLASVKAWVTAGDTTP